jgi:uracil-DNA glycosylase family 4
VGEPASVAHGDDDIAAALGLLARGLAGAIEVSGLEHVPRPTFAAAATTAESSPTAVPPPTTASTTTAPAPTTTAPTTTAPAPTTTAPTTTAPTTSKTTPTPTTPAPTKTTTATPATTPTPAPTPAPPVAAAGLESPAALRQRIDAVVGRSGGGADRLQILRDDVIGACTRCKLHRGRNSLVFGVGNPAADLVFVGEGPGEDEDRQGIPFVGRAGQLLTKMIAAMGRDRDRDVYICNVVKCRPPNNRQPEPDEVDACIGFLDAQLAIVKPKVIVGLGGTACHTLLQTTTPISKLRGQWKSYRGIPFMPTFHPSYLLREERDPQQTRKREAWSDLKQVMARLQQP